MLLNLTLGDLESPVWYHFPDVVLILHLSRSCKGMVAVDGMIKHSVIKYFVSVDVHILFCPGTSPDLT